MKVGIVGLGLIGGSMAKAVKAHTGHIIAGWDISEKVREEAKKTGVIDTVMDAGHPAGCDMVIVALYPQSALDYLRKFWHDFPESSLVIDCCGTKVSLCRGIEEHTKKYGRRFTFVGGHPMAGIEKSGFSFSDGNLFQGAAMLMTPFPETEEEVMKTLEDFFVSIGFRGIHLSTAEAHDETIAYTSQLAHVISSIYAARGLEEEQWDFAAGSFRDLTRVAILKENMWAELFTDNKNYLVPEIEGVIRRLETLKSAIAGEDCGKIESLLGIGKGKRLSIARDKTFE